MAKSKSTPRGDQFEREYLLKMGLARPAAALSFVPYEQLCTIHDACVVATLIPGGVALLLKAEPRLPADLHARIEAMAEAVRHEVRGRGIPPRFEASWDAVDAERVDGGMGAMAPMVTKVLDS